MTIIIEDMKPAGTATSEVRFPGSKKTFTIPSASALTIGQLRRIQKGDLDALIELFPARVQTEIDALTPGQLSDFIGAWLADGTTATPTDAPKDSRR